MKTRTTIHGREVPRLGIGTWQAKGRAVTNAVRHALDVGYRHVDTAQAYGNEAEVGQGIRESNVSREDIFLTTKVWRENVAPEDVRTSTEESLEKLGTEYVDLLLIHWPVDEVEFEDTINAMIDLQQDQKVGHIGVSNFTKSQVEAVRKIYPIFANQVEFHPFLDQTELMKQCQQNDMLLTAYSPLARGQVFRDKTLQEIGQKYDKSPSQVTLNWLLSHQNVSAIPKSTDPEHIEENFVIFDFELTAEDHDQIRAMLGSNRIIDPSFAPDWAA